jgi:hypothetical protein
MKIFLFEYFFHLPLVSTTPMVHLINEKNLKSKSRASVPLRNLLLLFNRRLGAKKSILLGTTIYSVGTLLTFFSIKVRVIEGAMVVEHHSWAPQAAVQCWHPS